MKPEEARKIIINKQMTYNDFAKFYNISIEDTIKIFQYLDLKTCLNKENCVNDFPTQERRMFYQSWRSRDGLRTQCKFCADQRRNKYKEYINHFKNLSIEFKWDYFDFSINSIEQKQKWSYLNKIIKREIYNYKDISKILNCSIEKAIWLYQMLDLKTCANKNCVSPDSRVQTRNNFNRMDDSVDKLNSQCIYCRKDYKMRNQKYYQEYARQYRQENNEYCRKLERKHYLNNKAHYQKLNKEYRQNNSKQLNKKQEQYRNSFCKFKRIHQIESFEKTRQDPDNLELLQVKCVYCNSWFNPTNRQVQNRLIALRGYNTLGTENRLYCSNECKQSCPIYRQQEYSKDDSRYYKNLETSREVQPELRKLVFERDNWTCQKCLNHKDNLAAGISLHCHHVEGIRYESIESADTDMCITVCSECHKKIHQIPGCTYQDMQCTS